jgi:hypothetical protein
VRVQRSAEVQAARLALPVCGQELEIMEAVAASDVLILAGATGSGKCWAPGTQLLLLDGTPKRVEMIRAGDRLLGDDSTPRIVQTGSLTHGRGPMYRITPNCTCGGRSSWRCNDAHILVLRCETKPRVARRRDEWIINTVELAPIAGSSAPLPTLRLLQMGGVCAFRTREEAKQRLQALLTKRCSWPLLEFECTVSDFLRVSARVRRRCVMFQPECVHFPPLEPRPGMPLSGDLRTRLAELLHVDRAHVADSIVKHTARALGVWMVRGATHAPHRASCVLTESAYQSLLHSYGLDSKRLAVPRDLLRDLPLVRRSVLAGLIDGTGCYDVGNQTYQLQLPTKQRRFLSRVTHLARGLGLRARVYHASECSVFVRGNLAQLECTSRQSPQCHQVFPTAFCAHAGKVRRCDGFSIESLGDGEYYGFTVTGNGRLLLGDFTVTHNVSAESGRRARRSLLRECAAHAAALCVASLSALCYCVVRRRRKCRNSSMKPATRATE